jgi:catechol 2,3-dioxygenase-like lactoylglutathione lyase family enzyme
MNLNRAMIFVNDLPRMTAFYSTTLGLTIVHQIDEYVEFEAGSARFGLHQIPQELRCESSSPVRPRENNPIKLSFEVNDVETERTRLTAMGVTILTRPWGAYDGVDPEGNIFGIYSTAKS